MSAEFDVAQARMMACAEIIASIDHEIELMARNPKPKGLQARAFDGGRMAALRRCKRIVLRVRDK